MRNVLLSVSIVLCLSGCGSSVELNDQAFVSVIIVDLNEDGIEVTLGIPLTNNLTGSDSSGSSSGGSTFGYYSRTGTSIEEAMQKVQGDMSRKINIGQNRNIVVGRAFAEQSITPVLEMAARNPYIRMNTNLFFVDGYAKKEIAAANVVSERFFTSLLNKYVDRSNVMQTTIKDFMLSKGSGGDGLIPIITFSAADEGGVVGVPFTVGTGGAAVFKEGKLVDQMLTPIQTASAQSIRNQLGQFYFSVPSPTDGKSVGFYSTSIDVKTKIKKEQDRYHMKIKVITEAVAISNNSNINLMSYDEVKQLQHEVENYTKDLLDQAMATIQATGADVFHFDRYMRMKYPKDWLKFNEDWSSFYRNGLVVDIDTEVYIRRKGSTMRSFMIKYINADQEEEGIK